MVGLQAWCPGSTRSTMDLENWMLSVSTKVTLSAAGSTIQYVMGKANEGCVSPILIHFCKFVVVAVVVGVHIIRCVARQLVISRPFKLD